MNSMYLCFALFCTRDSFAEVHWKLFTKQEKFFLYVDSKPKNSQREESAFMLNHTNMKEPKTGSQVKV